MCSVKFYLNIILCINIGIAAIHSDHSSDIQFEEEENVQLTEGDYCLSGNNYGVCLPLGKCPNVLLHFYRGYKPIICSYLSNTPIVCCQPQISRVQNVQVKPTTRNTRISEEKCEEYKRLATHEVRFTLLTARAHVNTLNVPICSSYPTRLIVGGEITKAGEFPHMAAIGWSDYDGSIQWKCGGSLISEFFIVTAAHCTLSYGSAPDTVRLGGQNLETMDAKTEDFKIIQIITHPDHTFAEHYNDIALLRLHRRVQFSKFIRPACLWQNYKINSTKVIATGWGQMEFGRKRSDDLRKVGLNVIDNTQCSGLYGKIKRLKEGIGQSQLCAGYLEGGRDSCQGDSGGPIQVIWPKNKCLFYVVGITSFGKGCAAPNTVGVYTRISAYLDWIESIVWS